MRFVLALFKGFSFRRMPWTLLAGAITLALIGALFIRSSAPGAAFATRHLMFLAMGVCALLAVAVFDYRHLPSLSTFLYAAGLLSLVLLPWFGTARNNAVRWYRLGGGSFTVQPSEAMKYAVVVALATYFCYRSRLDRLRDLAVPLGLCLAPMFLIMRQPDLGSSLVFLPAFLAIAFVAGVPLRNLVLLVTAGMLLGAALWCTPLIKPYQRQRVLAFLGSDEAEGSAALYNAERATLAIVGGGVWGQGWGKGKQTLLRRLPEPHTDFIFAVIAEEWGFLRTSVVIGFYLLMACLMAAIVRDAPDKFGMVLATGVMALFFFQSLLHVAISLRLAPITGLTLPLISYGGSSLLCTMGGLGLIAAVGARRSEPAGRGPQ